MHSGGLVIQIHETGRNTSYRSLHLGSFLNIVHRIQNHLLDRHKLITGASLKNIKQFLLRFLQDHLCAFFLHIAGIFHFLIHFDQSSKDSLFADNIGIILYVGRSGNCRNQISYIFHTADIWWKFLLFQTVLKSDQIHRLSFIT